MTLFIYYALKHGEQKQKEYIYSLLGNKNIGREDVRKAQQLLREVGAHDYILKLGWKYVKDGIKIIPAVTSDKKLQNILNSLIVYIMQRSR